MAITTSLGAGTPPPVQIILPGADLTAGAPWFLDGSAGESSWRVRGGSGTGAGAQVVLIDVAAPINAQRFNLNTPCCKTGACANCKSEDTICCNFLITRFSHHPGRMHVILVNDSLGF